VGRRVRRQVEVPGQFAESIDTFREGKIWLNSARRR
jgi:hypothetical protein